MNADSIKASQASIASTMIEDDEPSTISLSYSELENETNNQNIIQEPASSVSIELKSDSNEIEMSSHSIIDEAIAVDDECPSDIEAIEDPYKYYTHLTLVVRIKNHYSATYDYSKKPAHRLDNNWAYYDTHEWLERPDKLSYKLMTWIPKNITGGMLRLNEIPYLVIIDIDINHSDKEDERMPEEDAEMLREFIINVCKRKNFVLAQTPSDGFHIYANCDDKWIEFAKTLSSSENISRSCEFSIKKGLSLDIFTSMQVYDSEEYIVAGTFKVNNVLMVPSSIKYAGSDEIKTSKFIVGSYESVIDYDAETVLETFSWLEAIKTRSESRHESSSAAKTVSKSANASSASDYKLKPMTLTRDVQQALINGIDGISYIHTISSKPFKEEVSTLSLFPGLNALDEDLIEDAYNRVWTIYQRSNPKTHTMQQFMNQRSHHQQKQEANIRYLYNVIKNHNRKYFDETIAPLMKPIKTVIDFDDEFYPNDISKKYEANMYHDEYEVVKDMLRVYRVIDFAPKIAMKKCYNADDDVYVLELYPFTAFTKELRDIPVLKRKNEKDKIVITNAYQVFINNQSLFTMKGMTFNSTRSDVYSVFHGWKWSNDIKRFNYEKIAKWLESTYEQISDSKEDKFKYILRWVANIAQYPGILNQIGIILKGDKGVGKNTFTDVVSVLFAPHSEANLTDLKEITGNFTGGLENIVLAIFNEVKNEGGRGKIKSSITEKKVRIEAKYMKARTAKNVCNKIFNTNEILPFKVESGDRRVVVYQVSTKHRDDSAYWESIYELIDDEFFNQLMTFFMNIDLSEFNPLKLPASAEEAKKGLIAASYSVYDKFIMKYYKTFINGLQAKEVKEALSGYNAIALATHSIMAPLGYEQLKEHFKTHGVEFKSTSVDGKKAYRFKLTDTKYIEQYKPDERETEEAESIEEEIEEETIEAEAEDVNIHDLVKELALGMMWK